MNKEDLSDQLENIDVPVIKNQAHQARLKSILLNSKNFKPAGWRFGVKGWRNSFVAMAVVLSITFSSVIGVASADASRPGDPLFGLDKLIEELQIFLTANPEAKLELRISAAKERINELLSLTEDLENGNNSDSSDISTSTSTPTSTDPFTSTTTSTTISTDEASGVSNLSSLQEAINQALAEVSGAIARVKEDTARLTLKAAKGETLTAEQVTIFIDQISILSQNEDLAIKELKFKVDEKKLRFDIKIIGDKKNEGDDDDENKREEEKENKSKKEAEEAIQDADAMRREFLKGAEDDSVAIDLEEFKKINKLLAQAEELFNDGNYKGAEQLAKQAKDFFKEALGKRDKDDDDDDDDDGND